MSRQANLLWVDLEMTGLEPQEDRILEVAAIATDWDFEEIASFESAVKVAPKVLQRRMTGKFWEENQEAYNQLNSQNEHGVEAGVVENSLIDFIKAHFDSSEKILLAGNSIHQDRRFIRHEWPRLDALLHYRMLDVSAWKVVFEGKYKKRFAKPEAHRALSDIRGSIQELQYYLGKIKT
jgi:oligoribonuclease